MQKYSLPVIGPLVVGNDGDAGKPDVAEDNKGGPAVGVDDGGRPEVADDDESDGEGGPGVKDGDAVELDVEVVERPVAVDKAVGIDVGDDDDDGRPEDKNGGSTPDVGCEDGRVVAVPERLVVERRVAGGPGVNETAV